MKYLQDTYGYETSESFSSQVCHARILNGHEFSEHAQHQRSGPQLPCLLGGHQSSCLPKLWENLSIQSVIWGHVPPEVIRGLC